MLAQLTIRDFALIDRVSLEFTPGFCVLTGETGAGKSILIDAIQAVLGERAGAELIRTGADRATVEAVFEVGENTPPEEWAEEGMLVLSRELSRAGRAGARVNGRLGTVSMLREVGDQLVDLHGQHDHQSLLAVERHAEMLDAWGGEPVLSLKREAAARYAALRDLLAEMRELQTGERERAQRLDLYRFQVEEIEGAHLQPGEEEELLADRSRLANAEKLAAAAGESLEALSEGEPSVVTLLGRACRALDALVQVDETLAPILESMNSALYSAEDAAHELRVYSENVEFNPARLQQVQERLDLIRTLKRKYGDTVEAILAHQEQVSRDLERLSGSEERIAALTVQVQEAEAALDDVAARLHTARREAAALFEEGIIRELQDLSMSHTQFQVSLETPRPAAEAGDRPLAAVLGRVEFLLSANPGEPLRPLARVASGGEMSRIMLALKSIMAGASPVPTLIFDEIDVGIGGRTAHVIADKLRALAEHHQVLCVTHLPQIAGRATTHFSVEKVVEGGRTLVEVRRLTEEERVGELARMLGGRATAEQYARELLAGTEGAAA